MLKSFETNIKESLESNRGTSKGRLSSFFTAYFSIICIMAGVGILSLPYTLKKGGWFALLFIYISGAFAAYNGVLLVECLYADPKKRMKTFPEIGYAAFGKWGNVMVQTFHYIVLLGVGMIFVMLIGIDMDSLTQGTSTALGLRVWTLVAGCAVAAPLIMFRSVKEITILGALGAISTLIVIFVVLGVGLNDLPNQPSIQHDSIIWRGLPVALATTSFSFGGNNIYPHIEAGMSHPKQWKLVMISAVITVCLAYTIICVSGYYVYGDTVKAHVLSNLPNSSWTTVSFVFITLHILFTAPIVLCSACVEFEKKILKQSLETVSTWGMWVQRTFLRIVVVIIVICVAMFVPSFGDFMSLVGSIAGCMVSFILPPLFHLKLFGWRNRYMITYLWISIIFVVGIFGCVLGAIDAIISLNNYFNSPTK